MFYYNKMNSSLKYTQLNNLYSKLKRLGFIDKKSKININQISKDLAYINKLMYDTYLIFNSEKTKGQKITSLHNLRDPKGKRLFTKKIAKKVYNRYSERLKTMVNTIKQRRIQSISNNQTGGELDLKNNKIDKILDYVNNDPGYKSQVLKVLKGYTDSPILRDIKKQLEKLDLNTESGEVDSSMWEWVFFPLYKLENLPLVGFMFEVPLDMISIVLDNADVIMEGIAPLIPFALDVATDVGSAVPIPGVNSAIAAAGLGVTLAGGPMEWLLADGLDVIGLFINIQRKQWGLAYLSALEVIPQMPSLVDAAVTNMSIANKYLEKGVVVTEIVKDNTLLASSLKDQLINDPYSFIKPVEIWNNVIYPNRDKAKYLQKLPIEEINNFIPLFQSIQSEIENFDINKLMEDSLDSKIKIKGNITSKDNLNNLKINS